MYIGKDNLITFSTGCDVDKGDGFSGSMLNGPTLTSRRELVEQLDSEPLFEYLIQNGVIDSKLVEEIRQESSRVKSNLTLLQHLEDHGKNALKLFINALRQTGQHSLASLLDDGTRLKPRSNSGYFTKARRKGQVSLEIKVTALRLSENATWKQIPSAGGDNIKQSTKQSTPPLKSGEWLSLEDIDIQIAQSMSPTPERNSVREATPVQQMEILEVVEDETETKKPSCLCACFSKIFSRKQKKPDKKQVRRVINRNSSTRGSMRSSMRIECTNGGQAKLLSGQYSTEKINRTIQGKPELVRVNSQTTIERWKRTNTPNNNPVDVDIENLKNLADLLHQKCESIYDIWQDKNYIVHDQLLKYFEQDRGVLVLDTRGQDGLIIVNIFMKLEQLEQLDRDIGNGKLIQDLGNHLVTEEVLKKVSVSGILLATELNNEEYECAEEELS